MPDKNDRIFINKDKDGRLETDITGLIYLLKEKKISPDSLVVSSINESLINIGEEDFTLDTYVVEESMFGDYILIRQGEDFQDELSFVLEMNDEEIDITEMFDLTEYFEIDELSIGATYYIYPAEEIKNKHMHIIPYSEALVRMEQGKSVHLDFQSDNVFVKVDSDTDITSDMLIEGMWAIATDDPTTDEINPNKIKKIDPFVESPETLTDRLAQHLAKDLKPKEMDSEEKDNLIDSLLSLFLKENVDNWIDDDIL